MKTWKKVTLREVADIIPGYAFKGEDFCITGAPVIKIKDINPPSVLYNTLERVDLSRYKNKNIEKYTAAKNDFVIAMTGATIGKVGKIRFSDIVYINQRVAKIRPKDAVCWDFIYYCAISNLFYQHIINNIDSNSAQENISATSIGSFSFYLPPLPEQKAIAGVLGSLDDKIDLLQRQNATLEAMAETLFRQWFIEDTQDDFCITSLSNIANFLNGIACQKYPPSNSVDKLPVLKIRELNNGISKDCDWATSDIKSEYIVKSGDVIFSWSGSLLVKVWSGEDCVLNQHLFKLTSQAYPKWFYYFWCKYHLKEFLIISESHATTMGHIKRSDLDAAEVLIPTDKRLQEMSCIMTPLWEKYIINQTQIRTLEKLRDTLLPKLMGGEVRVRVDE